MSELIPTDEPAEAPAGTDVRDLGAKLADMVEAEASAAESEAPPEDEEPPDEEQADPTALAMQEALGNYLGAVVGILGEDAELKPCVFCHGWGFNPLSILADTHSHPCAACGGIGRVATGSLVPGNETRMCADCNGAGFVVDPPSVVAPPVAEGMPAVRMLTSEEIAEIQARAVAQAGG